MTDKFLGVYPSTAELMPEMMLNILPANLATEVAERYEGLGLKYATDKLHLDGRLINAMMFTSRVANCREEVVDSVFCMLGWIFESRVKTGTIPDSAYTILQGLIQIYGILKAEEPADLAKHDGLINV